LVSGGTADGGQEGLEAGRADVGEREMNMEKELQFMAQWFKGMEMEAGEIVSDTCDEVNEVLRSIHLQRVSIPQDGHCQFRAIMSQVSKNQKVELQLRSMGMAGLRNLTADWMNRNRHMVEKFVHGEDYTDTWEQYIERLSLANADQVEWGTHVTLVAAASIFKAHIKVWSPKVEQDHQWIDIYPVNEVDGQMAVVTDGIKCEVNLLFVNGNHYESLEPTKDKGKNFFLYGCTFSAIVY
jgi:OTU-like cysteine protease